jgi:hypothetical protein
MTTSDQYAGFAKECLEWARGAMPNERHFSTWLGAWTLAAAKADNVIGVIPWDGAESELPN